MNKTIIKKHKNLQPLFILFKDIGIEDITIKKYPTRINLYTFNRTVDCVASNDAHRLYKSLIESIRDIRPVVIDFSRIQIVTPSFIEESIVKCYFKVNWKFVDKLLTIKNIENPEIERVINDAMKKCVANTA